MRVRVASWCFGFEGLVATPRADLSPFETSAAPDVEVLARRSAELPDVVSPDERHIEIRDWAEDETPVVLPLLIHAARRGALVLHAAALAHAGRGIAILGPSGAGKSTLATLASGLEFLSDEFNVVEVAATGLTISSTPLRSSSPRRPTPHTVPLAALVFPVKAREEKLVRVDAATAMARLAGQAVSPDRLGLKPPFALLARLAREVPAFDLHFRKTAAVDALLQQAVADKS